MANNNPNNNNIDIGAVVDRLDKLLVIMTRQSQGSQYGEIHGSQIRGGGLSSLSYSGGYYGDMTRKSADRLTSAEQSSLIRRSGLDASGLNKERAKESKTLEKLNRQLYRREKLLERIEEAEKRLYEIRNENSQQANEEKIRLGNKIEVLSRRKEINDRNINKSKNEAKAVSEEVRKVLEPLVKEAQKVVKAQDAKRKFDEDREKHRIKWFKSPQAYERHEDFLYSNDKNRNDLRRISDIVQQTGITNTTMPVVGEFGRAINKGLNAANQVLNLGDTYSQIRSMFGRGSSSAEVASAGGRAASVAGSEAAIGAAGGEAAVGEAAAAASGEMGALGSAAGGAASALGPVALAAFAVVGAFEFFKAGLAATAQYMLTIAQGNLEFANNRFAKEEERTQLRQNIFTEYEQKNADLIVKQTEAENAIRLKAAETAAAISVEAANVEAQKRVMAQDLAARKIELATEVTTGLLKDGINATAWNALRAKIELKAQEQTQNIETKRLEQTLGATVAQKSAELGIERSRQQNVLQAFTTKREGEYENFYKQQEAEWRSKAATYDIDAQIIAAKTQLEGDNNLMSAIFGNSMALNNAVTGADVARNGVQNNAGQTSIVPSTVIPGGYTSSNDGIFGSGIQNDNNIEYRDAFSNRGSVSAGTAQKMKEIGHSGGVGAALYDWLTSGKGTEIKKIAMEQLKAQELYPVKMGTIGEVGNIRRMGVALQKQYQVSQSNIETNARIAQLQADAAAQIKKANIDATANMEKRTTQLIQNVETAWLEMAQHLEKVTTEWEEKTNDFGISQGYIHAGQLRAYEKELFRAVRDDFSPYGVDMGKALEMRSGYVNATNRNIQNTRLDNKAMASLYKLMGHDTGFVAEYGGAMEIFNKGITESVDKLEKTMQVVNKVGLSGRKYAKEVAQNLKLAQKYNFKDGTEGLMRMTQWAMKTRFNMQNLGSMIDKVLEGGLEGVIEQSSRLQVLGGNAAIYSDPFSMMYNAAVDPEAYGKQVNNMIKGFGNINRKTGETEFNMNEVLMIREIAKNIGMDAGDLMDQARAENRRESVKLAMTDAQKSNFNADQVDYISNVAHYSKEKGGFAVNVYKGNGEFEEKGINEISPDDLEKLQPAEHEERVEEYLLDIKSAAEKITSEEFWQMADIGGGLFDALIENADKRVEIAHQKYLEEVDNYTKRTEQFWSNATTEMGALIGNFGSSSDGLQAASTRIETATNNLAIALERLVNDIQNRENNLKLNVDGNINIGGHSVDIVQAIQNDPSVAREIAAIVFRQGTINGNGGRSSHPINDGNRNTYNH